MTASRTRETGKIVTEHTPAPAQSSSSALSFEPPVYGVYVADRLAMSPTLANRATHIDCPSGRPTTQPSTTPSALSKRNSTPDRMSVSTSRNPQEQKADSLAEAIVRTPPVPGGAAALRRQFAAAITSTKTEPGAAMAPDLASGVRALHLEGKPLPQSERAFFEPRLGLNLESVRVHSDSTAARLASGLGAQAFTYESHIGFAAGQWAPGTPHGRRLLAHELTHVVLASAGPSGRVFLSRDPSLPAYLGTLQRLAGETTRLRPRLVVDAILAALRQLNLLDADNLQPVTAIIAQRFPREVLVRFVATVNWHHGNLRRMRVQGSRYRGHGGVGLFPVTGALGASAVHHFSDNLLNPVSRAGRAFFDGFIGGLRGARGPTAEDLQALTRNLALGGVVNAVAPVIFTAGTVHGIGRDLYETIRGTIEIIENFSEIAQTIRAFLETILRDPMAARMFGLAVARDLVTEIVTLLQRLGTADPIAFVYELGKLVGPTIVYVIMSFLGIPELAMAAGLTRISAFLSAYPRFQALLVRGARWFGSRVHPSLRRPANLAQIRQAAIERQLAQARHFNNPGARHADASRRIESAIERFRHWGIDIDDPDTFNTLLTNYLRSRGWYQHSNNPALVIHSRSAAGELRTLLRYSRRRDPTIERVRFIRSRPGERTPDLEVTYRRDGQLVVEHVEIRTITRAPRGAPGQRMPRVQPGTSVGRSPVGSLNLRSMERKLYHRQISASRPGAAVFDFPFDAMDSAWVPQLRTWLRDLFSRRGTPPGLRRVEFSSGEGGLIVFDAPSWAGRVVRLRRPRH